MALSRIYVSGELRPGVGLKLDDEQARYVRNVLRLRVGDALAVFNGDYGEYEASLDTVDKTSVTVALGPRRSSVVESPLKVQLVQGVSRGERMDFVVQKATELGVKRISPVLTQYGVVKLDAQRAARRRRHWQKVAASACEQSGRVRPPLIDAPLPLATWLGNKTAAADIDLLLKPGAATALTSIATPRTKVCLLIGPEGGFSATEYEAAAARAFVPVSLGPRILRTETAAVAALAIVQSLWGDLGVTAP